MEKIQIFHRVLRTFWFSFAGTGDFDAIQVVAHCYLVVIRNFFARLSLFWILFDLNSVSLLRK